MEMKKVIFYILYKPTKNGKRSHVWTCHVELTEMGKNVIKFHVTKTKTDAYTNKKLQLQNQSSTLIQKNKSFPSATSFLSSSPVAYNTTASLGKLTCTDHVDFGKCQDRFGRLSWSRNASKKLELKLKFFKTDDNKDFRLVQCFTMGEAD